MFIICLHTVKWLQVLLFNCNDSFECLLFVCIQQIGYKYCYLTLIILLNVYYLFAHSEMAPSIAI